MSLPPDATRLRAAVHPDRPRILSLCCQYPNAAHPGQGSFVRARLQALAQLADLVVVSPVAIPDYGRGFRHLFSGRKAASHERDAGLEVFRPRWLHPPLAGWFNPICLAMRLLVPFFRLRRAFGFSLIDAHFGHPDGVAAAILGAVFRTPFTVTLRGSEVLHATHPLRRGCLRWALRRAARIIAVSERLREFAISLGAPPARVRTIPNGVEATVFYPRDAQACRRKHGLAIAERIVLSCGHLIELKGHHRTVRALGQLASRGAAATLLIAGGEGRSTSYAGQIRGEAERCGLRERVRFLGHLPPDTLAEFMSAADVFCLASSREGWPNVVHEALSCGTPVVATDVGAIPQMIPSEQYGLIVPPGDENALAAALRRALNTNWDRLAIAAWGRRRGWDQVARELLRLIQELLRDRIVQHNDAA